MAHDGAHHDLQKDRDAKGQGERLFRQIKPETLGNRANPGAGGGEGHEQSDPEKHLRRARMGR
jgi:hypothetical protein